MGNYKTISLFDTCLEKESMIRELDLNVLSKNNFWGEGKEEIVVFL